MDTVLNLGLNDETVQGPDRQERRRALRLRLLPPLHPDVLEDRARRQGRRLRAQDRRVQRGDRREDRRRDPRRGAQAHGRRLQADRARRLRHATSPRSRWSSCALAIEAVFASWNNKRAIDYRNVNKIAARPRHGGQRPDDGLRQHRRRPAPPASPSRATPPPARRSSTATTSSTRRARTWSPASATPSPHQPAGATRCPASTSSSRRSRTRLENHYRDVQDLEFTIEQGRLYMLQTRAAKRTAAAAVKIAVDMVDEGLITEKEALGRVEPQQVVQLLLPRFDDEDISARQEAGRELARGRERLARRGGRQGDLRRRPRGGGRARPASRSSSCAARPAPTTTTA